MSPRDIEDAVAALRARVLWVEQNLIDMRKQVAAIETQLGDAGDLLELRTYVQDLRRRCEDDGR